MYGTKAVPVIEEVPTMRRTVVLAAVFVAVLILAIPALA